MAVLTGNGGVGLGQVGPIVDLQVQRGRLKPGPAGHRFYDPTPLLSVDRLHVTPDGCLGDDGNAWLIDVHHVGHPDSRAARRGGNAISVMTTGAYRELRRMFGEHLVPGAAGENVLLDSPTMPGELVGQHLRLGDLELGDIAVADPCVEFTRWCLGRDPQDPVDEEIRAGLDSLGNGLRGVYGVPVGAGMLTRAPCST